MKITYDELGLPPGEPERKPKVQSAGAEIWRRMRGQPEVRYEKIGEYWLRITTTAEVMPEGFTPPKCDVLPMDGKRK